MKQRIFTLVALILFIYAIMLTLSLSSGDVVAQDTTPAVIIYLPVIFKESDGSPPAVRILSCNHTHASGSGSAIYTTLWVVGEIINDSAQPIRSVRIEGTSSDGFAAYSYADMYSIGPGMKSPFDISFQIVDHGFIPCNGDLWYGLHVESYSIASRAPYHLQVTSQNAYYTSDGSVYNVEGTITNQFSETRTFIKAFVTLYNSTGEVIGYDYTYASPYELDPGENATFHVRIYRWRDCPGGDHDIASYQLVVVDD